MRIAVVQESGLGNVPEGRYKHRYTSRSIIGSIRYEMRYENGYNIFTDDSYVEWLLENHPDALHEHTLPELVIAEETQQQHNTPI